MKDKDGDEMKLAQDKMNRENAKKAVQEAREKTDDVKQQIFIEAKEKEQEMKKLEE